MQVYLAQHASAVPGEVDPARPLSEAGRHEAEQVAAFLDRLEPVVVRVLHSGRSRAQQTAEILAASLAGASSVEPLPGIRPNDPVAPVATRIIEWTEDTMVVGHQPFLGRLVSLLVARDEEAGVVAFQPGSVVCLERAEDGRWSVAWMVRPHLFPDA